MVRWWCKGSKHPHRPTACSPAANTHPYTHPPTQKRHHTHAHTHTFTVVICAQHHDDILPHHHHGERPEYHAECAHNAVGVVGRAVGVDGGKPGAVGSEGGVGGGACQVAPRATGGVRCPAAAGERSGVWHVARPAVCCRSQRRGLTCRGRWCPRRHTPRRRWRRPAPRAPSRGRSAPARGRVLTQGGSCRTRRARWPASIPVQTTLPAACARRRAGCTPARSNHPLFHPLGWMPALPTLSSCSLILSSRSASLVQTACAFLSDGLLVILAAGGPTPLAVLWGWAVLWSPLWLSSPEWYANAPQAACTATRAHVRVWMQRPRAWNMSAFNKPGLRHGRSGPEFQQILVPAPCWASPAGR